MSIFENLFGIKPVQIQKNCILTPYLTKNLLESFGINKLLKGCLYASGSTPHFSLIRTGIGAPFVGDAVLYLKETPCQNIFFLGSCGLIQSTKKLNIGSIVSPSSCMGVESFSQILNKNFNSIISNSLNNHQNPCHYSRRFNENDTLKFNELGITPGFANEQLLKKFYHNRMSDDIKNVICSSFGSLKMEGENLLLLHKIQAEVIDMECSAFFNASSKIKKRAMALLYVTDIVNKKPFYQKKSSFDNNAINSAIQKSIKILSDFSTTL